MQSNWYNTLSPIFRFVLSLSVLKGQKKSTIDLLTHFYIYGCFCCPQDEGEDELKKKQLKDLALMNGTLREQAG